MDRWVTSVILVVVGSSRLPFDRLVRALNTLPGDEELIVQGGVSTGAPAHARCVEYLAFDELVQLARRARVVVTHAGVGSIMTALAQGKRPVVVPRSSQHGEAVDDHQTTLARRLGDAGLVTAVEDLADLSDAVRDGGEATLVSIQPDPRLIDDLRSYLEAEVGRGQGASPRTAF